LRNEKALPENPIHLVVGTPCYRGQVTSAYFSSILKLQEACQREGIALSFLMLDGDDLVQRARQDIVADFMEIRGASHLLFIDADIGFEPDQVFRLLQFKADVVAATYPLKNIDWVKVRAAVLAGWEKLESAGLQYVLEVAQPPQVRDGFVRVLSTGTGFLLLRRSALAALMERYLELRYSRGKGGTDRGPWAYTLFNCLIDGVDGPYLSEDYSFCRLWTRMGGEIWVDLNSRLNHVGQVAFVGNLNSGPPPVPKAGGEA
jgi:hypothetical protein